MAKRLKKNPYLGSRDIRPQKYGQNWIQITRLPQRGVFNKKMTNVIFVQTLHFVMLKHVKRILRVDHEI